MIWYLFLSLVLCLFFHFNLFFLPLPETSTLRCTSLFSSCLKTTVILTSMTVDDRQLLVTGPRKVVSPCGVNKGDLQGTSTFFFFLFFFFLFSFFGLVTRRENGILKRACILSFLPSKRPFASSYCIWSFRLFHSFYQLQSSVRHLWVFGTLGQRGGVPLCFLFETHWFQNK